MSKTHRRRIVFGDFVEENGNKPSEKNRNKLPKCTKKDSRKKERLQVKNTLKKVGTIADALELLKDEE